MCIQVYNDYNKKIPYDVNRGVTLFTEWECWEKKFIKWKSYNWMELASTLSFEVNSLPEFVLKMKKKIHFPFIQVASYFGSFLNFLRQKNN